jgi:hypothetical protein
MKTITTTEGTKFTSSRFKQIKTVEEWILAFPARYSNLPSRIAKSFAKRDMNNAK